MFRERPLTWLFLLATLALDAVFVVSGVVDASRALITGFFLGQSAVLGAWLAVGSRHRLERGAIFVIGQMALTIIVWFSMSTGDARGWGLVLAALALYGATTTASVLLWKVCFCRFRLSPAEDRVSRMRYPLMELFGWTVVVAIACAFLRQAVFAHLLRNPEELYNFLGSATIIGLLATLFADEQRANRYAVAFWGCLSGVFFMVAYNTAALSVLVTSLVVSVAYTALWILVQRISVPSSAHTAPQIARDAQTSPPPPQHPHASVRPNLQSQTRTDRCRQ